MPTCRPCARNRGCSSAKKRAVADHAERLVEDRLVIAAVVGERRKILIDDLVVVGKCVGRNEIAPADFGAVDLELVRRDVEQPLDDENAMLRPAPR